MSSTSPEITQLRVDEKVDNTPPEQYVGNENQQLRSYFRFKAIIDQVLAVLLLVPFLPVIGFLVLLVRLTSKGPGLFRQTRVGRHGRNYTMLKLRSMSCDAEVGSGPAWTQRNDPRVTPLGRWLRKLHLDELPQLFNVLRGEMSLIGPRPERPEFVKVLREVIPNYERRLDVLPGITGLAQINLPPDSDLDSVRRKQSLDITYTQKCSLWLELKILFATSMRIVGIPGSIAARAACVGHKVDLPCPTESAEDSESLAGSVTLSSLVAHLRKDEKASLNGNHSDDDAVMEYRVSANEVAAASAPRHPR